MMTLPPSERDLHAYVDHQLSDADCLTLETWLAAHPEQAEHIAAWQLDAQHLRAALSGGLHQAPNAELDPAFIRQRLRRSSYRHYASAAVLLIAVSVGGLSGWQAREMTLSNNVLPMADAVQAYRMFAVNDNVASDWNAQKTSNAQGWLDKNFSHASRLPDLEAAGFKPISGRLTSTEQGAAAMVVYEDGTGRKVSFYIRPPGPHNHMLPRGSRRDGELQADYWSSGGYNYAMVSQADDPAAQAARQVIQQPI
ncbi:MULTISPECIES: anti-sigma factor [unclassified Pseudomonas]|uniref:anti-sigma factor family protein n=1 Tax=unclassified Pseudomonas TaxID=196821 RepID=UPI002AC942D1|nr:MULTISPECIES: anti-sigma factor [unclassified Pseudomonas]MEB0040570.1 anti-sigma factor [Pseudomonas sp. MH10]MEB0119833.1 anti-sigma factor [Pseudomonas sp. CCI1.2]WPX65316.1 anti-sigma factor [Pseudomonas sp. MH10]